MAGTSQYMVRERFDLYKDCHTRIIKVITKFKIPKYRFFRECINTIMDDPKLLESTIERCKQKAYTKK